MNCSKCGQPTGMWRVVWFSDVGGTVQEWVPHFCLKEESEVAIATPQETC